MPRKSSAPVSSFGPELLAALLRGGQSELRIDCPTFQIAFALRQRFYSLRKAMKAEGHEQLAIASRACIPLPQELPNKTAVLVIRPHDDEFSSLLRSAGVTVEKLDFAPLEHLDTIESSPSSGWLDSILKHVELENK